MNKKELATKLRWIFESQGFHYFYSGPMDTAITCEFERGTAEHAENEKKINEYLERMAEKLLNK